MTQEQLDILCVNTQSNLGLQGAVLVDLIQNGDLSAQALTATHFALHGHMRAIKDYDIATGDLTDAELELAEDNINLLLRLNTWT